MSSEHLQPPACRPEMSRSTWYPRRSFLLVVGAAAAFAIAASCVHQRMVGMPGETFAGALPPLTEEERALSAALRADVEQLATTIGERNLRHPSALAKAADFVAGSFGAAGYSPQRQRYLVGNDPVENVDAELTGNRLAEEIVVIGGHYDSVNGTVGANDNGSGAAAVLALARAFAKRGALPRTLRFVEFTNEEPPYFQKESMGSLVYARRCKERGERIVAMLSLETIGYYSDEKDSQHYPPVLSASYPSTGNFIAFVGDTSSRDLVRRVVAAFRGASQFPSEGASPPASLPGVGFSDQWSFWQVGYPGAMITDTAMFRYPYYHSARDTPEKLDYERMARVVRGLEAVVLKLATE